MLAILLEWTGNALMILGGFLAIVAGIDYWTEPHPTKVIAIAIGTVTFGVGLFLFRRLGKKMQRGS
ncbi:MAG: hypothetical protein AB8B50_14885 [Pirellulaceae bacterium]